jgi:hypothetical protein
MQYGKQLRKFRHKAFLSEQYAHIPPKRLHQKLGNIRDAAEFLTNQSALFLISVPFPKSLASVIIAVIRY